MSEPKPFASLSPSLLARKGSARPAMRPQIQPLHQYHDVLARQEQEHPGWHDLGWNDMGHDDVLAPAQAEFAAPVQVAAAETVAPTPKVVKAQVVSLTPAEPVQAAPIPEVVRQREEIAARVARKPRAGRRSALAEGRRAAFTLRVDAERHLKLRLACTLRNRSAQQLLTEALDSLLAELPEVATLAAQVAAKR